MKNSVPTAWIRLCTTSDIARRSSRQFTVGSEELILIRKYTRFFAYRNSCPHLSISVDMGSEDVLTDDRKYILCANHAALFEIDTGMCVSGPCIGEGLEPMAVKTDNEIIYVKITD